MDKQAEYIRLAHEFVKKTGRVPSRIDWRGKNRQYWSEVHQTRYPSTRTVEFLFKSWNNFLIAAGYQPRSSKQIANIAIQHVCTRYPGTEVAPGRTGSIDCFIGGERIEVKSSSLSKDHMIPTPRWRFRLHNRTYSCLVDKVILVGIVGLQPVVEWTFDQTDMVLYLDNRDNLAITARQAFGDIMYPFFAMETWKADLAYEELMELVENE